MHVHPAELAMIDYAWWTSHLTWFLFGGVIFFAIGFALASIMAMSGRISQVEDEVQDRPVESVNVVELKAQLASTQAELEEARADVDFYYKMATGGMT